MRISHFILVFCSCFLFNTTSAQYKTSSVLSEGTFYKIAVSSQGIHKLDRSFFKNLPEVGSLNPNLISLLGNNGGMVPELISADRVDDLEEIPLKFIGNNDNEFGADEFFIFYAEGPQMIEYDDQSFSISNSVYETKNFYFICTTRPRSKNIESVSFPGNAQGQINTYDEYQKYDKDAVNLLGKNFGTQGSGKTWYGEAFSGDRDQEFKSYFNFDNTVEGSTLSFYAALAARSDRTTAATLIINEDRADTTIPTVDLFNQYATYALRRSINVTHQYAAAEGIKNIEVVMNSSSAKFGGWLDYISCQSEKNLVYKGGSLNFRKLSANSETLYQYNISSSQALTAWLVTNPHETKSISVNNAGSTASFVAPQGLEYVVFNENQEFSRPTFVKKIENQNIHAIMDAEYVILYHANFSAAAKRLANHRASFDGLITYVIDIDKIFNEFSGGSKDPIAIRDFARMLFKRSATFEYLCLFGDASYDYRGINPELAMNNFVPCYETDESLSPVYAFPTDDFYALLSDNEGGNLKGGLDIAVGRLPVASVQEANTVVDKLIGYDTDPAFNGEWKNNFILVADDEDGNSHLSQTERLATTLTQDRPAFNQRKVYFDAFKQVSTTGDARYPLAEQKLNDYMFQGALLVNYFGHGGPNGWAQERVLEIQDILSWTNKKKLPLFITATCTFTGYDDPDDKSGGELTLLNPNGGSIGLVSTTRAVTISANERLVKSLFTFIYDREDNKALRMGEVLRRAKNNHQSDTLERNARKFALIGDPAFRLSFPEHNAVITSLQGNPVGTSLDTIRALDAVNITGEILGFDGALISDYNGLLEVTVMDKAQTVRTLGNDARSSVTSFKAYNASIFKGKTLVTNGKFEVQFRVPKDIDYEFGFGRISLYASESNSTEREASGYYDQFVIGGTSKNGIEDNTPPALTLFINNTFFEDGGLTGPDPLLIAKISDDLGINISNTSIGHEMVAILDENLPGQVVLNDYYQASATSILEGEIRYPFNDLEDGSHTLRVRVWDVANNASEATLNFIVEKGRINLLENVNATPNPAIENIEFSFTHQLSYAPVDVFVEFYNSLGQPVSDLSLSVTTGGNTIENIEWNRVGYNSQTLNPGVYYYKITASATSGAGDTETATSPGGKIILLN